MKILFHAKLNVPKPYTVLKDNNALHKPCLIMQKINGTLLTSLLFKNYQYSVQLFDKMI